jgi:hypothetical protein
VMAGGGGGGGGDVWRAVAVSLLFCVTGCVSYVTLHFDDFALI